MRQTFIETLTRQAAVDERIFLLTGDLGFSVVEDFAKKYPDRFLNVGVAEQDMTGIAVGLSREGYSVFTYSIGNFPTLRCMEQIRYDVCYHEANVKIIAVGGGFAYGPLGASHHTTEDLGMLRTLPGMIVSAPGDPHEVEAITRFFTQHEGPGYMRLNKNGEPAVHDAALEIDKPRAIEVIRGTDMVVLATGAVLHEARRHIVENHLPWGLVSFPFVKPIDHEMVARVCARYPAIATFEEHQLSAGFGSAVLESINDLRERGAVATAPTVRRVGIRDVFNHAAGTQTFLRETLGLTLSGINH